MATYRILKTRREDGINSIYSFVTVEQEIYNEVPKIVVDELTGEQTTVIEKVLVGTEEVVFETEDRDVLEKKLIEMIKTVAANNITPVVVDDYTIDLIFQNDNGHVGGETPDETE